jgi:hypothetical protein
MVGCDRRLKMNFGDGSGRTRHASSDLKNKLCRSALLAAYGEMRHDENPDPGKRRYFRESLVFATLSGSDLHYATPFTDQYLPSSHRPTPVNPVGGGLSFRWMLRSEPAGRDGNLPS